MKEEQLNVVNSNKKDKLEQLFFIAAKEGDCAGVQKVVDEGVLLDCKNKV